MKKIMVVIVLCVLVTGLKAQNTTNFCDPALENEIINISGMGGTFLKSFLISDLHYTAELIMREDNTYRFYIKSSSKFHCEAILTVSEEASKLPIVTLRQKSNDPVAFDDFTITKTGRYLINVSFKDDLKGCALVILNFLNHNDQHNLEAVDTSKVFVVVENNAQFKGGDINGFRNYVATNFKIDTAAMRGVSGKIIVQFVVNTSGRVQDVKVIRSCGQQKLDDEAVRVIKSSPLWIPAKIKGISVKQSLVMPVKIN
jgi:TonB family protein